MMNKFYCLSLLVTSSLLTSSIQGQGIKLTSIFGDHMVIQQGINASVWGISKPGSRVSVDFAGFVTSAVSDQEGDWMVKMPVLNAGGPYEMKISGIDSIILKDVMVGEVWLASGQSNMEWTMGSGVGPKTEEEVAEANYPGIRFYNVPKKTSSVPLRDTEKQTWTICSPETIRSLSAVSYFFARELCKHKNVAVGIISSSWGATSAEAWISSDMLATHPDFRERVLSSDNDTSKWNTHVRESIKAEKEREIIAGTSKRGVNEGVMNYDYNDSSWEKCMSPVDMPRMGLNGYWGLVWLRKSFDIPKRTNSKKMILDLNILARDAILYFNGTEVAHLINPAKTITIDIKPGILHQGHNVLSVRLYVNWGSAHIGSKNDESYLLSDDNKVKVSLEGEWKFNSEIETPVAQWQDYYNNLSVLLNARIAPLIPYGIKGVIWYQGENNAGNGYQYRSLFPLLIEDWRVRWQLGYFPFLYVQLANYMEKKAEPAESGWAELREAQLMTLKYPNTGMAVTIDIGDPNDIHPRNKLDVGKRLFLLARKVAYGEDITASGPLYQSAKVEGQKIRISFSSTGSGLTIRDGDILKGFAVAGSNRKFYWADTKIADNGVLVSSPEVPYPQAVRYSWEDNPDGNLINKEGLPASPFRTDNWNKLAEN
jgi:sialate O-acetylesterase